MTYAWAVIGAGPAGIAAVGKLLDHGVADKDIVWIDPDSRPAISVRSGGRCPVTQRSAPFWNI